MMGRGVAATIGGPGLLQRLGLGRRPAVADAPALGRFLVSRTAFVAQKVTVEYCRARAGIGWDQLMAEAGFAMAMETCRWEAFAAVYPDVAETCQIRLRHAGLTPPAVGEGLADVAATALQAQVPPPHRSGWDDVLAELPARLERALLASPHAVHRLGAGTVTRILAHIPFHPRLKNADRDIIDNGLRLALCGVYAEFERAADTGRLAAAMTALAKG